jgi:hypothetical protein
VLALLPQVSLFLLLVAVIMLGVVIMADVYSCRRQRRNRMLARERDFEIQPDLAR